MAKKRLFYLFIAATAAITSYLFSSFLTHPQRVVLATLVFSMVLWVSEVVPLYITSMTASFLLISFGPFSPQEVFQTYFDPVIVLFLGGFVLARGLQKFDLDKLIAHNFLNRISSKPSLFILGSMFVTAFLSLWMSNTASAAIMIPIIVVILKENNLYIKNKNFTVSVVLGIAYAATIGGIGSPIGSPPNAIAIKYLDEQGLNISFVQWMIATLPFVILALLFTWFILITLNRLPSQQIKCPPVNMDLKRQHYTLLFIFLLTFLGWLTTSATGLSAPTIALIPIILLFSTGLLNDSDLEKIPWGTLLLFGGGLSLGQAITSTKIDYLLVELIKLHLLNIPIFFVILLLVIFGVFISMAASNTASAAILIPLLLPLSDLLNIPPQKLATLLAIGVSLDFMIPIGTPPNAIAYSTGLISVREMVKNGFLVNMGTSLLLALFYYFFYL